jgi:hypothetical protein
MNFKGLQIKQQIFLREKVSRNKSRKPHSRTSECINGVHLVTTFKPKDFTEADAYVKVPEFIKTIYKTCGIKMPSDLIRVYSASPTTFEIECTDKSGKLIIAFAIGMNKTAWKWHIHFWIYGVHRYDINFAEWCFLLKKELNRIKGVGDQVFIENCFDNLDQQLRNHNGIQENYWEPLVEYLTNRNHQNLMGYFARNNSTTFYHYTKE